MGVSPPPFHGGFLGQPWYRDPSWGGLWGLGRRAGLLKRGPREGGSGQLSPPAHQALPPAGPGRAGASLRGRGAPGRPFAPPRWPRGRPDARPGRGAEGRGEGSHLGSAGWQVPVGGGGPSAGGGAGGPRACCEGAGVGAENEWRLPAGVRGPPPPCARAVLPRRRETVSSGRRRRLLGDRCRRGGSWAPVHSFGDRRVTSLQSDRSFGIKNARCPCKEFCSVCCGGGCALLLPREDSTRWARALRSPSPVALRAEGPAAAINASISQTKKLRRGGSGDSPKVTPRGVLRPALALWSD